jgi:ABC-type transport system substrate-binding protein
LFEYCSPWLDVYSIPNLVIEALESLHISASYKYTPWLELEERWNAHQDYDMAIHSCSLQTYDVDWLAYEYWSEYANTPYQNPTNFRNATYDSWRDQLLHGTTYEEVHEAAAAMQEILQYNVPRLVVYLPTYPQAYRNDRFSGYIENIGRGISDIWTMRKIHYIDGTLGGTFPIAISIEPDNFNVFSATNPSSAAIMENLWPSLYNYAPDLSPYPDLANNMKIEYHEDNIAVPEGHTRYTVDIIQNATWSDGVPLTAEDVAFTFIYVLESGVYGNPAHEKLKGLIAAYSPSTYRVVIEFSTESYWHFSEFAYTAIIPEHIFNNNGSIDFKGWETWNPFPNSTDSNVNCGPFLFSSFQAGEFYELVKNPLFYYEVENMGRKDTTTTNSTEILDYGTLAISIAIGSVSGFVIVVFSYRTYLELQKNHPKLKEIPWNEISNRTSNHREW